MLGDAVSSTPAFVKGLGNAGMFIGERVGGDVSEKSERQVVGGIVLGNACE